MLPSGPCWKSQVITTTHPTKSPVVLYWCDPLECISNIFNHPLFHDHMDYSARRAYTCAQKACRVYTEWMTGNRAWEIQVRNISKGEINSSYFLEVCFTCGCNPPRHDFILGQDYYFIIDRRSRRSSTPHQPCQSTHEHTLEIIDPLFCPHCASTCPEVRSQEKTHEGCVAGSSYPPMPRHRFASTETGC
jgi:hypothetical protein